MKENKIYKNILPPIRLLNESEQKQLFGKLEKLNFSWKEIKVA